MSACSRHFSPSITARCRAPCCVMRSSGFPKRAANSTCAARSRQRRHMKKLSRAILCVVMLAPATRAHAQEPPRLWGDEYPGKYTVGFTAMLLHDSTRTSARTHTARPVQIALWYPAQKDKAAKRMTFGDYVGVTAGELAPATAAQQDSTIAALKAMIASSGAPVAAVDSLFASPMYAIRDATPDQR